MKPDFLIIGAQKGGSTFLQDSLREHPNIYMPYYESPFFEDPEYDPDHFDCLLELFKPARPDQICGIKRPDYLPRGECPARIHRHVPQAKLIAVLREPVARMISAYFWYMQVGVLPIAPASIGLEKIAAGEYQKTLPRAGELIEYGFYYEQLTRYLRLFAREQLLVISYDDLQRDPLRVLRQVFRFLEVEENYVPRALGKKPKESVYSLPRLRLLARANRTFFYDYIQYGENRLALRPKMRAAPMLAYRTCVAYDRLVMSRLFRNEKPRLSDALIEQFQELYQDDIAALKASLGIDLASTYAGAQSGRDKSRLRAHS